MSISAGKRDEHTSDSPEWILPTIAAVLCTLVLALSVCTAIVLVNTSRRRRLQKTRQRDEKLREFYAKNLGFIPTEKRSSCVAYSNSAFVDANLSRPSSCLKKVSPKENNFVRENTNRQETLTLECQLKKPRVAVKKNTNSTKDSSQKNQRSSSNPNKTIMKPDDDQRNKDDIYFCGPFMAKMRSDEEIEVDNASVKC